MKKLEPKARILASLGALCLFACAGGTGEGNPEFGYLSVSLKAQSAKTGVVASAPSGFTGLAKASASDTLLLMDEMKTPYAIHHIYVHVDQVEMERPKGGMCLSADTMVCTDSSLIVLGSRHLDLLENPSSPIFNHIPLPLGLYNRMKIRFSKLADSGQGNLPAEYLPLKGHSILMKGTFAYRGVANRDLSIYLDVNEVFAFENASGLAITTDSPYKWAGIFQANRWLENLEITECLNEGRIALNPDGSLVIDSANSCNDLEDSLKVNVRGSTLFEDEDHHELGP